MAKSSNLKAARPHQKQQNLKSKPEQALPFKRPIENTQEIDPQLCKDKDGNWTKWVIERLDSKELKLYEELVQKIKDNPLVSNSSVNKRIRNLVSSKWNVDQAAKNMVDAEQFRIDNKLGETCYEQVKVANEMGFIMMQGHDKSKRPLVWVRSAKLNPDLLTKESSFRFAAYLLDYCSSQMSANVDQFIKIYDTKDFGRQNMNYEITKAIINITSVSII